MRHFTPALCVFSLLAACSTTPELLSDNASSAEEVTVEVVANEPTPAEEVRASSPTPLRDDVDDALAEDGAKLTLQEQRKVLLVERHLENANDLRDRLRLEDARTELELALGLAPDNLQVKRALAEVNALLGVGDGEIETVTSELNQRHQLRVQQLKVEAAESLRKGKGAIALGDYEVAIAELTIAMNHVRWAPYSIDWSGMDEEITTLLAKAKLDKVTAGQQATLSEQQAAFAALQAEGEAEAERKIAILTTIFERGILAFEKADYDQAIDFADQVLRKDPTNEWAKDLRQSSYKAGREQVRGAYVKNKREQFARWREQMDEKRIPWVGEVILPDRDEWRKLTELRAQRKGLDITQKLEQSDVKLRESLKTTIVRLGTIEEQESLQEVMAIVKAITGLPIVVDPAAEEEAINEAVSFDFSLQNALTAEQIINLITDAAGEEVTWTIRHDAILVTTREKARGEIKAVHHDVQDLVFGLTDFLGPRIDQLRLLDELEDDDGGGPFGGIGERPMLIDPDDLSTMIRENVMVGTWDDGPNIESYDGHLIITHTADAHVKVRQFLEDLRRFSSSMVTIESKFMTVSDNFIQEFGFDFRGLATNPLTDITNGLEDMASAGLDNGGTGANGPNAAGAPSSGFFYDDGPDGDFRGRTENMFESALGDAISTVGGLSFQLDFLNDLEVSAIMRAVEKTSQFELINDQVLSVHNTQRAFVTVINQKAYIQDFDVEVAQFQAVADPQVNVLHEGVVLDVRPTIHHDRKYLRLEIQPTVAKIVALEPFSSTLGGNTSPVEFALPELEVQSIFTTADIPDGGSVMLGGLSNIRNIERRAEVPWLAKVPLIGFFFKEEGYNDENESLMILIRARITDVRDEVKRLEASY
jgi:type II secretory pathway component GspD/PulD (secretin)